MNFRKLFIAISNRHDVLYRIVLITVAVLIVAFSLPRQLRFRYNFKLGQPWSYEDLKAPFPFPLYKSGEAVDAERALINRTSPRFYRLQPDAPSKALERFNAVCKDCDSRSQRVGEKVIRLAYIKGIIEGSDVVAQSEEVPLRIIDNGAIRNSTSKSHLWGDRVPEFIADKLVQEGVSGSDSLPDIIRACMDPDLIPDAALTAESLREQLEAISLVSGEIPEGSILIRRGQVVDQNTYDILESLRRSYRGDERLEQYRPALYAGYLVVVAVALGILLIFLWILRRDILLDSRRLTLLILLIVSTCLVYSFSLASSKVNMHMLPLCILPLVTRAFFDTRTALFTHVLTMLMLGTVAPTGFEFVYMQIVAGMVAIFSIVNMNKRSQLFLAVSLIVGTYLISHAGLELVNEGRLGTEELQVAVWLGVNGLLTLLSYPLIFFIEKLFGVTSDFSLMELTDFNSDLLRELSLKAPGTFQHSLQVANLAEAAIFKIGGNSLLMRAGALYHDIGKADMPMYFIENQSTQVNPHDELSFDESSSIIISHVIRGIEKAKKHKLPDVLIDFIRTHHGTMRVEYFYNSFIKDFPDQIPNEEDFQYTGPKPFSKETAVLMMADSVEAAARSLPVHDAESLDRLVEHIIQHQVEEGQFENCDITYKDITSIKKIFKKMLSSVYHVRVAYPS